jgi:hypothetical protein
VLLLSQKYLWPLKKIMALKTCATNNNLHPKGFFFWCQFVMSYTCMLFIYFFWLRRWLMSICKKCLVIVYNKNTIYLRKIKFKKKNEKHVNFFHNAFTFQECCIWLLFYSSFLPYLFMDYVMFSCCWYCFRIIVFTRGGKIDNWVHIIDFLKLIIAWDAQ